MTITGDNCCEEPCTSKVPELPPLFNSSSKAPAMSNMQGSSYQFVAAYQGDRGPSHEDIRKAVWMSSGLNLASLQKDPPDFNLNSREVMIQHGGLTSHGRVFPIFPFPAQTPSRPDGERTLVDGCTQTPTENAPLNASNNGSTGNSMRSRPEDHNAGNLCRTAPSASKDKLMHRPDGKDIRPYKCPTCPKSFPDKNKLERHIRVHTGEKPFGCSHCGKAFAANDKLVAHRRIHTGERPFRCDHCGKSFALKEKLTVHRRIHSGEKPYGCTLCHKSFARKENLNVHRRVHTGEKPFPCRICDKSFAWKDKLVLHSRIHTGEKPYCCDLCEKRFARKDKLTLHRRVHTGERPFPCRVCGKAFKNSSSLKRHENLHINRYYQGGPI